MSQEKKLFELLKDIAPRLGKMALPYYGKIESQSKTVLVHGNLRESPVTAIDHCLQELVLAELVRNDFLDVSFNGEEDTHLQFFFPHSIETENGITVHCDPIDGTHSFFTGKNRFGVGLGLSRYKRGKHHFFGSVIYSPIDNQLFWAFEDTHSKHEVNKHPPKTLTGKRSLNETGWNRIKKLGYERADTGNAHLGIVDVALGNIGAFCHRPIQVHDGLIPYAFARAYGCIPLDEKGKKHTALTLPLHNGQFERMLHLYYFASKEIQKELLPIIQNRKYSH